VLRRSLGASELAGGAFPSDGGKRARKRLGGLGSMRTGVTAPRDEPTRITQPSELGFTYQQRRKPVTDFPSTPGVTPLHESRGSPEGRLPSPAAREGRRRRRERWAHRKLRRVERTTETPKLGFRRKSEQARPACWAGPAFQPGLENPRPNSIRLG
jgi:hypothetical protein